MPCSLRGDVVYGWSRMHLGTILYYTQYGPKGGFFSESVIRFSNLQISKIKIFQITILSLKFEFVVYCYWREI